MNNKGLTLVEIIAVLVVLSVIAVIVTPNVMSNISKYRTKMYEAQLKSITEGAKSWVADNIDKMPSDGETAIILTLSELQSDGYVEDNLKNPKGGSFDDYFSIVFAKKVEDKTGNFSANYVYAYGTYENMEEYLKETAIKYKKEANVTNACITTNVLKDSHYLPKYFKDSSLVSVSDTKYNIPDEYIKTIINADNSDDQDDGDNDEYIAVFVNQNEC